MTSKSKSIVIDSGSWTTKIGFVGAEQPKEIFPSIVGWPEDTDEFQVGDEVKEPNIELEYPIDGRVIKDWDGMQKIWEYAFDKLQVDSEEHAVLLTEPPLNPMATREKMVQVMFETFKTTDVYLSCQPVLALHATGNKDQTGIIIDSGYSVTHIVPIADGYCVSDAITRLDIGGLDITNYLDKMISDRGYEIANQNQVANEIKEKWAYVVMDARIQKTTNASSSSGRHLKSYTLPDGQSVVLGDELFSCSEALFSPSLIGKDMVAGIHKATNQSISKCQDPKDLYAKIILAGGNTMFQGIGNRLAQEMKSLAPLIENINVVESPIRKNAAWIGGSLLASQAAFDTEWLSKADYDESGPSIVKKCF
ncbi:hypothetical protein DFA_09958 [Cavenderia fasciculata]|uniref:Actin n=1 Tax=Cavenderia fasciculata TaxID=261658 RepID=F4Q8W5_CACFS|nr:uncharacterized protein DFA_09958 [Cavenderia fasciculata]EGG15134.1 hypothetical protein DFA_09958 [Cavenderia fasciculata]|eukprot:XP_004351854.1 hypothetical protein DFA_09958 [Cavenderia fasciculata]